MMRRDLLMAALLAGSAILPGQSPQASAPAATELVNPLLTSGPDPWIVWRDGFYYEMHSTGVNLTIRKTRHLAELAHAEKKVVWQAPASGPYSRGIWAPELHYLRGKWYIYFAADAGSNASHRIWVLENESQNPIEGDWRMKGKVADEGDHWAIDATILQQGDRIYMVWSGWEGSRNGQQNLYIAELSDPWTMKSRRVKISQPEYPWEKVGDLKLDREREVNPAMHAPDPVHIDINEGPEILRHGNRIFIIYSAAACWTDYYSMGMLQAEEGADLLDPQSWRKSPQPLFWQSPRAEAYGTGHGSFFQSPDGTEDWMVYHANRASGQGCGDLRSPRAQRFTWNADGTPNFGRPIQLGVAAPSPKGERE